MATSTQISLEEYLHTAYEPDAEYVDREIEERNAGEYDHASVQASLWSWFQQHGREWRVRAVIEQRTLLNQQKVRIPDVSVFPRDLPIEQVFTYPQLIAIEVLSPEDRHPKKRIGRDCSDGNWMRKERFEVAGSAIYLSLDELFRRIDEDEAD